MSLLGGCFVPWFLFDEEKGYHSCAYLGRIARTSDQLTDAENKVPEQFRVTDDMKQTSLHAGQKFYGPNGATPDEVIHRLNFEMKNETGREVEFDGVFGGKR